MAHTSMITKEPRQVQHMQCNTSSIASHRHGADPRCSSGSKELVELAGLADRLPPRRIRRYPECGIRHASICRAGGAFIRI